MIVNKKILLHFAVARPMIDQVVRVYVASDRIRGRYGGPSGRQVRARIVRQRTAEHQRCRVIRQKRILRGREIRRWKKTLPLSDFQSRRQLLLPLRASILKPRFDLNLCQVQTLGQLHSLAHAEILVDLKKIFDMIVNFIKETIRRKLCVDQY